MQVARALLRSLRLPLLLLGLAAALLPREALAGQARPPLELSLRRCVGLLLKANHSLRRERLALVQARKDLLATGRPFDLTLSAQLDVTRTLSPKLSDYQGSDEQTYRGKLTLSKKLVYGTVLSLGVDALTYRTDSPFQRGDIFSTDTKYATLHSQSVVLSISQPLLRGAWKSSNLAARRVAKHGVRVSRWAVRKMAEQLVGSAIKAYWELSYSRGVLATRAESVRLAQRQLSESEARVAAGKLPANELFQVRQVVAVSKGQVLLAGIDLARRTGTLRGLLNLPAPTKIRPISSPTRSPGLPTLAAAMAMAERNNADLAMLREQVKVSGLRLVQARDSIKPDLKVFGSFTLLGKARDDLGSTFSSLVDPGTHTWTIGVLFSHPLTLSSLRASRDRATIEVRRARLLVDEKRKELEEQIRTLLHTARVNRLRVATETLSLDLARRKLAAERAKLTAGRSTLFAVLQYQRDLATARLARVRARIDVALTEVELALALGILLESHGVARKK